MGRICRLVCRDCMVCVLVVNDYPLFKKYEDKHKNCGAIIYVDDYQLEVQRQAIEEQYEKMKMDLEYQEDVLKDG